MKQNTKPALKYSRQRAKILELLRGTKKHPTADWVYTKLKPLFPRLSLGTVYRNLNLLRDQGQIQELCFGSTFDHFDGNPLSHYHFVCQKCGRVFDVEMSRMKDLDQKAEKATRFNISSHRLEFFGKCSEC